MKFQFFSGNEFHIHETVLDLYIYSLYRIEEKKNRDSILEEN